MTTELQPRDVAAYLATTGWQLDQIRGPGAEIWRHGDDGARVLLPVDPTFDDYPLRMGETLRYLSAAHEYTVQELATSVMRTRCDILYVRAEQTTVDGAIPLREADALLSGSVRMLEAAALSTVKRAATFASRRPRSVVDFMNDDLRMGHTQRGSFVITILTRLGDETEAEAPQTESSGDDEAPRIVRIPGFQRRVMTTLSTGLVAAARTAADPRLSPLAAGVDAGASSNLYGALDEMTGYEGLEALDLSFAWAPAVPQYGDIESTVVFTHKEAPRFKEAKKRLRQAPGIEKDSVTGQVVRLDRGADKEEGVVTITGVTGEGKKRNVRLRLQGETYRQAVRSHDLRAPVTCSGELEKQGTSWWLRNPVFTVVPK